MVVDYSKWDKLELSDDSDIEVHPNVDKKSFIRWKQRDIHEKREQMKARLTYLKSCNEMNSALIKRVDQLIASSEHETISIDIPKSVSLACKGFTDLRPSSLGPDGEAVEDEGPAYTDMIESLLVQVSQQVEGSSDKELKTIEELKKHREQLEKALTAETKEYEDLLEERSRHILSDDIHTGFDSTLINKPVAEESKKKEKGKQKESGESSSIEVINSPGVKANASAAAATSAPTTTASDDDIQASSDALEFANLPMDNLPRLYNYLENHPHIVKETEKDALMMVAFEQQLSGEAKKKSQMKNTVHNALLLQYCATLGPEGTRLFFTRISNKSHPALEAFMKDVDFTCNHIKQRCEIISQQGEEEEEEEGVEQIQLHSVDPNTEIVVTVPEPDAPGRPIYDNLQPSLRIAIETKKLDEINKVLGEMSIEEAEQAVEDLNASGVLSVEEKIYDVNEWQAEKERLLKEETYDELEKKVFGESAATSTTAPADPFAETNDEVD